MGTQRNLVRRFRTSEEVEAVVHVRRTGDGGIKTCPTKRYL